MEFFWGCEALVIFCQMLLSISFPGEGCGKNLWMRGSGRSAWWYFPFPLGTGPHAGETFLSWTKQYLVQIFATKLIKELTYGDRTTCRWNFHIFDQKYLVRIFSVLCGAKFLKENYISGPDYMQVRYSYLWPDNIWSKYLVHYVVQNLSKNYIRGPHHMQVNLWPINIRLCQTHPGKQFEIAH